MYIKAFWRGFSGSPVVKSLPWNAGDIDSIPDLGRSLMTQKNKHVHHNYRNSDALKSELHNKRGHCDEKPAHRA